MIEVDETEGLRACIRSNGLHLLESPSHVCREPDPAAAVHTFLAASKRSLLLPLYPPLLTLSLFSRSVLLRSVLE